jgi:hypothetical protein
VARKLERAFGVDKDSMAAGPLKTLLGEPYSDQSWIQFQNNASLEPTEEIETARRVSDHIKCLIEASVKRPDGKPTPALFRRFVDSLNDWTAAAIEVVGRERVTAWLLEQQYEQLLNRKRVRVWKLRDSLSFDLTFDLKLDETLPVDWHEAWTTAKLKWRLFEKRNSALTELAPEENVTLTIWRRRILAPRKSQKGSRGVIHNYFAWEYWIEVRPKLDGKTEKFEATHVWTRTKRIF